MIIHSIRMYGGCEEENYVKGCKFNHSNPANESTMQKWDKYVAPSANCIAIASGQADWVLAWLLFCRLNVHMCTLNKREGVHIKATMPSCLGKWLPIIVQMSPTKRQCCVRVFSRFGYSIAIPLLVLLQHIHGGTFIHRIWSHYLRSPGLVQLSIVCHMYVYSASNGKLGDSLEAKLLIQHSMWIRMLPTAKKRSLSKFFCCGGIPSICSYYVR